MDENNINNGEPIQSTVVNEVVTTKSKSTRIIPKKDIEFINLCSRINENWNESIYKLNWITKDEFTNHYNQMSNNFLTKQAIVNQRSPVIRRLNELETTMNKAIEYVKGYISEKYGKDNLKFYYKEFGIVKSNNGYKLPKNREECKNSLLLIIDALNKHEFSKNTYGTQYWTDINNEYITLISDTFNNDGKISLQSQSKNTSKQILKAVIDSLILLIKANNPSNYKSELRTIGFQKEKY